VQQLKMAIANQEPFSQKFIIELVNMRIYQEMKRIIFF